MRTEVTSDMIRAWYAKEDVQYEIVKNLQDKEVIFMQPEKTKLPKSEPGTKPKMHEYDDENRVIWGIKAFSVKYLKEAFDHWKFFEKRKNIYYTVDNYDDIPTFSYDLNLKYKQLEDWVKNHKAHMKSMDFVLDFDMPEEEKKPFIKYRRENPDIIKLTKCYIDCKRVKTLFDHSNVPYTLCFSGMGFHMRIRGEDARLIMPEWDKDAALYRRVINTLRTWCNTSTLDTTIYTKRRLWKAEYTLDVNRNIVLIPLSDEDFEKFDIRKYRVQYCLKRNYKNRGLLYRYLKINDAKLLFKSILSSEVK